MKTIAITIDEGTLKNVDELIAHSQHLHNRSALVRTAVREFAERERQRQTEEHERAIFHKHRRRLSRQARALIAEQART
jgi:metal-responsive CopG/Arc/MetJ family transcriptional regulator